MTGSAKWRHTCKEECCNDSQRCLVKIKGANSHPVFSGKIIIFMYAQKLRLQKQYFSSLQDMWLWKEMRGREFVCVCVWECGFVWEREKVCVCESESMWERVCMCLCVCVCKRERENVDQICALHYCVLTFFDADKNGTISSALQTEHFLLNKKNYQSKNCLACFPSFFEAKTLL